MFLSEDDIVKDMLSVIEKDVDNMLSWSNASEEDLILQHHNVGRHIRNHYKLWHTNNPYVVHHDETHHNFPDQMSQRIIHKIWKTYN